MSCKSRPSELCRRPVLLHLLLHLKPLSWPSKLPRSFQLQSRRICRALLAAASQRHRKSRNTPSSQSRARHARRQPHLSSILSWIGQSRCISLLCPDQKCSASCSQAIPNGTATCEEPSSADRCLMRPSTLRELIGRSAKPFRLMYGATQNMLESLPGLGGKARSRRFSK